MSTVNRISAFPMSRLLGEAGATEERTVARNGEKNPKVLVKVRTGMGEAAVVQVFYPVDDKGNMMPGHHGPRVNHTYNLRGQRQLPSEAPVLESTIKNIAVSFANLAMGAVEARNSLGEQVEQSEVTSTINVNI